VPRAQIKAGSVDRKGSGREVVQTGVLRGADAILNAGVRVMLRIEVRELPRPNAVSVANAV
jgi:hypothetical protein